MTGSAGFIIALSLTTHKYEKGIKAHDKHNWTFKSTTHPVCHFYISKSGTKNAK